MAKDNRDVHKKHRERLRNEFIAVGLEHFADHKILELLLFYSIPLRDTNAIGHRLLERFGSLSGVFDAPYELLQETEGVGPQSALLIKLVSSIIRAYMDDYTAIHNVIDSPEAAKEYMRYKFLCEQLECVYMACLGNNGKVIFCERIAEGSPESVGITPSVVVKTALRANAVRVVLAHNHPHGICNPSTRDLGTTSVLYNELIRVDVELLDHVIVAPDGVCSMREMGMLPIGQQDGIIKI